MRRTPTLVKSRCPALSRCLLMGRIERLRRCDQIAPQASRQCSRLGCSTAVASLACHGICAWRLVPRTPRHMPRQTSRSLGGAVAARRQLPLPCKHVSRSRRPFQSLEAPCRAGYVREAAVGRRRRKCRLRMPHRSLALRA